MHYQKENLSFEKIPVSSDWCFKNSRSIQQWTHGHHRYPAKFLPNLVKKLIEEYSSKNDLVVDFFAGCGTTLVEAKVHGRKSIGVDINPVAELITKAKINPINPNKLENRFNAIINSFEEFNYEAFENVSFNERIDYWFSKENKIKIAFLIDKILDIKNRSTKEFFLVALSHILKNCSKWLQSSTKPQIDPKKNPADPFDSFKAHTKKMINKNAEFYEKLSFDKNLKTKCEIRLEDARRTSIRTNSVEAIITSPPYVTSYEYADIHQLTGFWYNYINDLPSFRKNFIGTFYSLNQNLECETIIGQEIINLLYDKNKRTAKEVTNYFKDMQKVVIEMHRVLKKGGHLCIVIGNTTFKNVKIKSAEVLSEILINLNFELVQVIKRSIPYKLIPTIRDKKTGKFTKLNNKNSKLVYPEEYILIAKKV